MNHHKCLYCYEPITGDSEFHESCSRKFFGSPQPPVIPYSYNEMTELAKEVVQRSIAVPGVQPKLSMSIIKDAQNLKGKRLTVVGALGGDFIFKPPSTDFPEMPANEHVTMRIAEAYGINVVPSSLIRLHSGELSYITKRIDRTRDGQKVHMLDMFQITEAFDKYKSSMEKVGKALGSYSANPLLDKLFLFELTIFSFLTGNNDMHLKNFSMNQNHEKWGLAPAYDLLNVTIILPDDTEELALTLNGKKSKLTRPIFEGFAKEMGLNEKQISSVFSRFLKNLPKAENLIEASFLSEPLKIKYLELLKNRYQTLFHK
ncbi:HipA domain-containing protein [Alkalitalea saponilacus]|uniref:Serine/threonine-protein kinase HipA n=1 Tax=Alkalitalea saponilacus TaxID=889453 RepID=A0A1T5D555_9BACT|nr:HipA domain-containing protein [Alkalitalea saponilacus]ASB50578.1 phosphatidylinositol kinase [Alkalitalea saponilacus]SKB66747.1 serine/threonine-protein kinase HipA [Alkalitalea saponilacus]